MACSASSGRRRAIGPETMGSRKEAASGGLSLVAIALLMRGSGGGRYWARTSEPPSLSRLGERWRIFALLKPPICRDSPRGFRTAPNPNERRALPLLPRSHSYEGWHPLSGALSIEGDTRGWGEGSRPGESRAFCMGRARPPATFTPQPAPYPASASLRASVSLVASATPACIAAATRAEACRARTEASASERPDARAAPTRECRRSWRPTGFRSGPLSPARRDWGLPRAVVNSSASRWTSARLRPACLERCARSSSARAGRSSTVAALASVLVESSRSPDAPSWPEAVSPALRSNHATEPPREATREAGRRAPRGGRRRSCHPPPHGLSRKHRCGTGRAVLKSSRGGSLRFPPRAAPPL